jgi:hypothetical protein
MTTYALTLVPIDPDNETHMAELVRQREVSGVGVSTSHARSG